MQVFTIQIGADYKIREVLRELRAREWETILDFGADLFEGGKLQGASEAARDFSAEIEELKENLRRNQNPEKDPREQEKPKERGEDLRFAELETELQRRNQEVREAKELIYELQKQIRNAQEIATREPDSIVEERIAAAVAATEIAAEEKFRRLTADLNKQFLETYDRLSSRKMEESSREAMREAEEITQRTIQSATLTKLDSIVDSLKPIIKHYSGNNIEKGNSGESTIYNVLYNEDYFDDAIIDNVSNETANGDIMITWRNLKCMIEVKNKQRLSKEDITKFERDISQLTNASKINCAVFITLECKQIPNKPKGSVNLEFIGNTPVVYLYSPPPSKDICIVIKMLSKLIEVDGLDMQKEMANYFIESYQMNAKVKNYFEQEIEKKQKEIQSLQKLLNAVNDLHKKMEPLQSKLHCTDQDPVNRLDRLADTYIAIAQGKETVSVLRLMDRVGFTVLESELPEIAKAAIRKYLKNNLSESDKERLILFNQTNGRWPTRTDCRNKPTETLTENTIRKMAGVIRGYKLENVLTLLL